MKEDPKTPEIPALGDAYNHARKAYGLTSALLIAWELIGVELEANPIESVKLTLKSPQAAPYVLIVLIIYFGFRMTIEWYQNDIRRRRLLASRIDFVVAHVIATVSLALYGFQTLLKIQLANTVPPSRLFIFTFGFAIGEIAFVSLRRVRRRRAVRDGRSVTSLIRSPVLVSLFFGGCIFYWAVTSRDYLNVIFVAASGLVTALISLWVLWRIVSRFSRRGANEV